MKKLLTALLLLPLMICGCVTDDEEPDYSLKPGDNVPSFSVVTNDGATVDRQTVNTQVTVITFFNTSCDDCRRELPRLQAAYAECMRRQMPVRFVCIAREETQQTIAAFWQQNNLTLPYSPQPDRRIYNLFAASGIPRIYITKPADDGAVIAAAYTDTAPPDAATLISTLQQLLH